MTTLNVYSDYIPEAEGGRAIKLARPTAPIRTETPDNVVEFRRREA